MKYLKLIKIHLDKQNPIGNINKKNFKSFEFFFFQYKKRKGYVTKEVQNCAKKIVSTIFPPRSIMNQPWIGFNTETL